ncbi:MAG: cytochrome b N-terminal domain-containing protein [Actinomycetota bacterium]|nr:cytochrome b N-terminal domain-containing protein [Actinomycetota bacterium]
MSTAPLTAVDLSSPGRYLHWSILQISEANLVLILVMVVIFGAALLIPFPSHGGHGESAGTAGDDHHEGASDDDAAADPGTATMWTARLRRRWLSTLPPGKLLPDRQPAYVASWVYVFGVGAMVALGVVILSGVLIALGGPDWWHTDSVGHFFNSLHLWSVELFMALMVIHLWGKFWMAAWRGRRRTTWITGVVAFVFSVFEAFTGYLSQQNFDSQWIATNGKDAFNAAGIGAFLNVMNFGQMLMWHILLMPLVLVAIVGAHILLVRVRGVSHPLPASRPPAFSRGRTQRRALAAAEAADWKGPTRRYDIIKEGTIAGAIVLILVVVLAGVLSSPDDPPVTVQTWAKLAPDDFLATAAAELDGSSTSADYGPPYNNGSGSVQQLVINWQKLAGVRLPVDSARDFVISPLTSISGNDATLAGALRTWNSAPSSTRQAWADAYSKAVANVTFSPAGTPQVPSANDGPVPEMMQAELTMARSGALDTDLLAQRQFYGTNFTKPLLFIADGQYYVDKATAMHLTGSQWGVMNETGSYPGQPWLWLYTLWYQVPGFRSSTNVDLIAIYMTGVATALLLAVPFIPGLRDIPRWVPVHRLVWRDWNRRHGGPSPEPPEPGG